MVFPPADNSRGHERLCFGVLFLLGGVGLSSSRRELRELPAVTLSECNGKPEVRGHPYFRTTQTG